RRVARPDVTATKEVLAVLDEASLLPQGLFRLLLWVSEYYAFSLGGVIRGALPQGIHAVVRRRYSLTESGKKNENTGKPLQQTLAAILAKEGSLAEPQLRKKWAEAMRAREVETEPSGAESPMEIRKRLQAALAGLRRKGAIREGWEVDRPRVRTKVRRMITLKEPEEKNLAFIDAIQRRAPQQAQVLKVLLSAGGSLPSVAFEGPLRSPLKRLLQKGWVDQTEEAAPRVPKVAAGFRLKGSIILNEAQQAAADEIVAALRKGAFSSFLLHGVTGSGKTEVYLRVVEQALKQKKGAILLVPEIGLTAQLVARFHSRFGDAIALFHSGLSPGERYDEWRRIKEGKALLAIGVRSAVFAPFEKVGVIIVDEEQDTSYKQEDRVRYHARDVALVRGKQADAVVVLGSATPSFESFYNSRTGKYRLLSLPARIDSRPLPAVQLIDLKEKTKWVRPFLTQPLLSAIEKRLSLGEQTLLFINRRGFSPSLLCGDCGDSPQCVRCSVSLTFHKKMKRLLCHYCGFQAAPPGRCRKCQGVRMIYSGIGTEQVEEEIRALFPAARLARMDRDTTQKKESHHQILAAMEQEEIDILIGTQMIAKGHDFPKVTLVGVLCADLSLHFPDFRSSERTFQMLTQVAGRAGRGELPGEVIIQTFQPGHESIVAVTTHDYLGFYEREMAFRKEMDYPPFCRLILLALSHHEEGRVAERAEAFASSIRSSTLSAHPGNEVTILGPAPAPLLRLKGSCRYQLLLKGRDQKKIASVLKKGIELWKGMEQKGVRLEINVDPQSFG
ncbi:MAG TPA: primosomal protein N', partial [Candidatus Manganitrophaceae bacterium]|nr:primosomal protein N' [Candidatus Manganitrophaceae bacterium]